MPVNAMLLTCSLLAAAAPPAQASAASRAEAAGPAIIYNETLNL